MEYTLKVNSSNDMVAFGEKLGRFLEENMVILMEGDLGAGKTTMTKGIAKALGVTRVVNSPTFTILKIYDGRLKLYHMDVYRLSNDSGDEYLEEYFEAGGVTIIEWAHQVSSILPKEYLLINIEYLDDGSRLVKALPNGEKYERLLKKVTDND